MIIDPLSFGIDNLVLSVAILEVVSVFIDVRIETTIFEGTFSFTFIEQPARNLRQSLRILLDEVISILSCGMVV